MKHLFCYLSLIVLMAANPLAQESEFPVLEGPYLGQIPVGTTPQKFAPDIVSTASHEFSCSLSPDGNEFYFARRHPVLNETVVMVSRLVEGAWTEPDVAPFVKKQFSFEPSVTPDNKRLYFQSGEPIPGQAGPPMNVLYVEREGDGWGDPINPGPPFNPAKAMHISATSDGTLYTTDISKGPGTERIGVLRKNNGEYKVLDRLDPPINADIQTMHPYIAPDESYMIFGSLRHSEEITNVLSVSYRKPDGSWSEPRVIDLGISAGLPFVTDDGKFLFFTSGKRGEGDIYWVSADIIKEP